MTQYKFTKDIAGSNNGYIVNEYKKGEVIEASELNELLLNAWLDRKIILPLDGKKEEPKEEPKQQENDDELIGDLVYQAKEILAKDNGEELTAEEIAKLKEIGVSLKIKGMATSKKPQTILTMINDFIDKYENIG